MFDDVKTGREAAKQFEDYWVNFVATNPHADNAEWKFAIGMIYFEGFINGFEYKREFLQEIAESN